LTGLAAVVGESVMAEWRRDCCWYDRERGRTEVENVDRRLLLLLLFLLVSMGPAML
jgi:hypothetical protein